jgi:tripartite-type tricarboxylate transporter receptor subunit TctC
LELKNLNTRKEGIDMKNLVSQESLRRVVCGVLVLIFAIGVGVTLGLKTAEGKSQKDAAAFYKGKNLTFIVPYTPGGGYDAYSRLIAPYLRKYTGARIIVRNMPGAGGMLGVNELYSAPPNGLTIGIQNAVASVTNQIVGIKGVRYDLTKFGWIVRLTTDPRVLAMRKGSPIKTIQQLINAKGPVTIGATGLGGSTYVDAVITKRALNLPVEIIHGYDSSSEIDLGLLRGEIDGTWGSYGSRLSMVEAGEQFIILQNGKKRFQEIPNIPTWFEVAPSEKAKRMLSTLDAMHQVGRPVAAPPGIPKERLEFLRKTFDEAMNDPGFIKDAEKAKRALNYLSGEEMGELAKTALEIPEEDIKQIFVKAIKGEI